MQVELNIDIFEEKINTYLKNNFYTVTEGPGFVIFIDDKYSDKKMPRLDYHNRIGEGKFEINEVNQETAVKRIYFTPVLYPAFLVKLRNWQKNNNQKSITFTNRLKFY